MNRNFMGVLPSMILIRQLFAMSMMACILLSGQALAAPEKTVVIRVVGTNTRWGQEPKPGWPNASPVKDAQGYSLYDLEIGRIPGPNEGDSEFPGYLALYKFKGYTNQKELPKAFASYGMSGQDLNDSVFEQYKAQSTIKRIDLGQFAEAIDWDVNSQEVLVALKTLVDQIIKREKNVTRWVLAYSGHGAPWVFFEGMISNPDSETFVKYLRQKTGKKPLILDFSTNCEVGFFEFALRYYRYADYLIASDKTVGGFNLNPDMINEWLAHDSDSVYDQIWRTSNSLDKAVTKRISDLEFVWNISSDSLREGQVEQSLSVYKLAAFSPLMKTLKAHGLTSTDLSSHSSDLATYAYDSGDPALIKALENFRIGYTSDRAYAEWTDNSLGFSVYDPGLLDDYLGTLP